MSNKFNAKAGYCKRCESKREICEECGRPICDCYDCGCYAWNAASYDEEYR